MFESFKSKLMTKKQPLDKKILNMNGFPLYLEIYDSRIVIKDEHGNSMRITKKSPQSIVLVLKGIFSSKK